MGNKRQLVYTGTGSGESQFIARLRAMPNNLPIMKGVDLESIVYQDWMDGGLHMASCTVTYKARKVQKHVKEKMALKQEKSTVSKDDQSNVEYSAQQSEE